MVHFCLFSSLTGIVAIGLQSCMNSYVSCRNDPFTSCKGQSCGNGHVGDTNALISNNAWNIFIYFSGVSQNA